MSPTTSTTEAAGASAPSHSRKRSRVYRIRLEDLERVAGPGQSGRHVRWVRVPSNRPSYAARIPRVAALLAVAVDSVAVVIGVQVWQTSGAPGSIALVVVAAAGAVMMLRHL